MRVLNRILPPMETTLMVRDYCGSHIYRDNTLERINNDYGYWANGNWYYYIKDYQGNVRAVIGHTGNLLEVNNYYPSGALMGGGTVGNNQSFQPYKYGTKELDRQNVTGGRFFCHATLDGVQAVIPMKYFVTPKK